MKAFLNVTDTIALSITVASNAPARGVMSPSASSVPPPTSHNPAANAIRTGNR